MLVRTERPGELHNARPTSAVKLLFCCECAQLEKKEKGGGLTWPGQTGAEPSPARASSQSDDAETVEFSKFLQTFLNLNL